MRKCLLLKFVMVLGHLSAQDLHFSPNPFEKITAYSFSLSSQDTVSFAVMDVLGEQVITVYANVPLQAGIYSDSLDFSHLQSGIYFARLEKTSGIKILRKLVKGGTTALAAHAINDLFVISPNPSSTEEPLRIDVKGSPRLPMRIHLFSMAGRELMTLKLSWQNKIMLSDLDAGVYLLRVETSEQVLWQRIVRY